MPIDTQANILLPFKDGPPRGEAPEYIPPESFDMDLGKVMPSKGCVPWHFSWRGTGHLVVTHGQHRTHVSAKGIVQALEKHLEKIADGIRSEQPHSQESHRPGEGEGRGLGQPAPLLGGDDAIRRGLGPDPEGGQGPGCWGH